VIAFFDRLDMTCFCSATVILSLTPLFLKYSLSDFE